MAIKQSDLYNKRHDMLRRCVGFDFDIVPEDRNRPRITLRFSRASEETTKLWNVQWHSLSASGADDVRQMGYSLTYAMPMEGMQLTMICAYGLRCMAAAFADTIQDMSAHEYVCYDLTKDM